LPWVTDAQPFGFDAGIDSIAVSGHKFIGSPMPCGVVLARRQHVDRVARSVEYVGCMDTTIAGSRNAITPLILWCAIQRWGEAGLRSRAEGSIAVAQYAVERFNQAGVRSWRHRNSITVVFPRPKAELIARWQLAPFRDIAHVIAMPQVSREIIDDLIADVTGALRSEPKR
jgi:histidine decarboxylase